MIERRAAVGALLALLLTMLTLPGCESIVPRPPTTTAQIDAMVANEEYGAALAALHRVPVSDPDYDLWQRKLKSVEKLAGEFEVATIRKAMEFQEQNKWAEALAVYDEALPKYPESTSLARGRNRLLRERGHYLQELDAQATITHAANLLAELKLREELVKIAPNDLSGQWELERVRQDIDDTTTRLIICGSNAVSTNAPLARKCLAQAKAMQPSEEDLEQIGSLEKWLAEQTAQASGNNSAEATSRRNSRRSRRSKRPASGTNSPTSSEDTVNTVSEEQIVTLTDRTAALVDQGELIQARRTMVILLNLAPDDARVGAVNARLQAAINLEVQTKIDQGRALYRQERIEQAKAMWEDALALDPENEELTGLVQRAERVLDKLEKLRETN